MERELFDWDGWDEAGEAAYLFYNVVLKVPMGNYVPGMQFTSACLDYQNGILEFYWNKEVKAKFKLKLTLEEVFSNT